MRRMGGISRHLLLFILAAWPIMAASPALSFDKSGCASGECRECHRLTADEAAALLGSRADRVLRVEFSEVPGMWVLEAEKAGRRQLLYLPYSRSHVFTSPPQALARTPSAPRDTARIDPARIPLDDALVLGRREAPRRVIVFTDPLCPKCRELHLEMEKVVKADPETAFFIKLYPLPGNPASFDLCRSIRERGSVAALVEAFAGKTLPAPVGDGKSIEHTVRLASALGIRTTPTMILPDGEVLSGSISTEALVTSLKPERKILFIEGHP